MIELWGGIECSVNRVGDRYFDQIARTGHEARLDDIDRFAALEIRTVRYPVLWERIIPSGPDDPDWRWTDERLGRLRDLGIRPIVGLCHHGSGPRWTGLLDPEFPHHLARFARKVIERYPWLDAFTPINEPLTTARFAGLYGHWHPHGTDERIMIRALLHQCLAVQLAMREIRQVQPGAQLIQTEDLGRIWSTPSLRYQADYENERRWLSLDLLFGRVRRGYPLWHRLEWLGISEEDLRPLVESPSPPDIIGGNYYITSERFLDHRRHRYPAAFHGGNGRHDYADIEAVRVLASGVAGAARLLEETWARYGQPVAMTEAHLGSPSPDEQLRWVAQNWHDANGLRDKGVDLRAMTIWSLFGAWDWHCLITREEGVYEPGAFDVRGSTPRPTAMANLVRQLASGGTPASSLLDQPGWWNRPERLLYPAVDDDGLDVNGGGHARAPRTDRRVA